MRERRGGRERGNERETTRDTEREEREVQHEYLRKSGGEEWGRGGERGRGKHSIERERMRE